MFRLLWQCMFGRCVETECAPKHDSRNGYIVCPLGKTNLSRSKVSDGGKLPGHKRFVRKGPVKEDRSEPKKPIEPSGGEHIPMRKCPFCESSVQIYAPHCPKCGTRFFRGPTSPKIM